MRKLLLILFALACVPMFGMDEKTVALNVVRWLNSPLESCSMVLTLRKSPDAQPVYTRALPSGKDSEGAVDFTLEDYGTLGPVVTENRVPQGAAPILMRPFNTFLTLAVSIPGKAPQTIVNSAVTLTLLKINGSTNLPLSLHQGDDGRIVIIPPQTRIKAIG